VASFAGLPKHEGVGDRRHRQRLAPALHGDGNAKHVLKTPKALERVFLIIIKIQRKLVNFFIHIQPPKKYATY